MASTARSGASSSSPPTRRRSPQGQAFRHGPDLETVLDEPGWYRGDLHAHTPESSDAFKSGSALSPAQWAEECRRIGLDYLALTDHNVVSQNFAIADSAGEDVLLMAGEEMTNWFHGHATVSGITPGDWFDWRQLPGDQLTAQPDPRSGSIQQFLEAARASGAYISAAHPLGATLAWRFFPEAAVDPAARTDGLEIWTGPFQADDEAMLKLWDQTLLSGQRIVGNGGSDLHGTANNQGFASGTPTTVVHADALSKRAVIDALKRGRSFVTRLADGVEVYLTGTAVDGQRQIMGGTLYGAPTDTADFEILVRRAGGMRLTVVRDGVVATVVPITPDEQTVPYSTPIGAGGFVRVEVRGEPFFGGPSAPLSSRTDMEAFSNPVFLQQGAPPAGTQPDPTQPPAQAGPRRSGGSVSGSRPAPGHMPDGESLSVGGATVLPASALASVGAAVATRRLSHSELRLRAATGDSLRDMHVRLTGKVTAVRPDGFTLTHWIPGCCSAEEALDVVARLPGHAAEVGSWWEIEGVWVEGTGRNLGVAPEFEASNAQPTVAAVQNRDDPDDPSSNQAA